MSDRGSRDRQVMTLLVQLFGRDVMDRLAGAGFDAPAAMAKAGAEKLAAEAGIPLAIARRVAIVVEESPGPAPAAPSESAARTASSARAESATRSKPVERANPVEKDESAMLLESDSLPEPKVREERPPAKTISRKRSEPRVAVEPIEPSTPAVPPPAEPASPPASAASAASGSSAGPYSLREEGDPFVDDVALVSWMGLSSHQPDGRLAFTVSDTILDPVGAMDAAAADDPAAAERDAARPSEPERLMPAAAAPIETPARPSMISGSFWTFGRPADSAPPSTGPKPETQPPAASPRRRKHDGH